MRRNQNHPSTRQAGLPGQPPGNIKTTLPTKIDIKQRDIRAQLSSPLDGLSTRRRHTDNHHPLTFQQATSGSEEPRAVINNQTAQRHDTRIAPRLPVRSAGSLPACHVKSSRAEDAVISYIGAANRYLGTAANRNPNWMLASKTDGAARANLKSVSLVG